MIRPIVENDIQSVINTAISSSLFPAEAASFLGSMMSDYFSSKRDEGHRCVIAVADKPVGVAYYEPAQATDGTWYLTMIAINGDVQGRGYGAALMKHMEDDLKSHGQRLVLVETSGVPEFELTRQFYLKRGYEQEARVRDYYEAGDDMILFRKKLNATNG